MAMDNMKQMSGEGDCWNMQKAWVLEFLRPTICMFTDDRCCMFRACLLNNVGFGGSSNDFFLQLMKTFMSSKILYTPDNQHTRKIIERVSGSRN
jgi:hypothetical protein